MDIYWSFIALLVPAERSRHHHCIDPIARKAMTTIVAMPSKATLKSSSALMRHCSAVGSVGRSSKDNAVKMKFDRILNRKRAKSY
jgi:hypothetical protein